MQRIIHGIKFFLEKKRYSKALSCMVFLTIKFKCYIKICLKPWNFCHNLKILLFRMHQKKIWWIMNNRPYSHYWTCRCLLAWKLKSCLGWSHIIFWKSDWNLGQFTGAICHVDHICQKNTANGSMLNSSI